MDSSRSKHDIQYIYISHAHTHSPTTHYQKLIHTQSSYFPRWIPPKIKLGGRLGGRRLSSDSILERCRRRRDPDGNRMGDCTGSGPLLRTGTTNNKHTTANKEIKHTCAYIEYNDIFGSLSLSLSLSLSVHVVSYEGTNIFFSFMGVIAGEGLSLIYTCIFELRW